MRTAAGPAKGGFNSSYYSNPEVDELLDQARVSTDPEERADLYKQVQAITHEDAPWLFVANWKQMPSSQAPSAILNSSPTSR